MIEFVNDYIGFAERFKEKVESIIVQEKFNDTNLYVEFVSKDKFCLEYEESTPFVNTGMIIGKGNLRQIGYDGNLIKKTGIIRGRTRCIDAS